MTLAPTSDVSAEAPSSPTSTAAQSKTQNIERSHFEGMSASTRGEMGINKLKEVIGKWTNTITSAVTSKADALMTRVENFAGAMKDIVTQKKDAAIEKTGHALTTVVGALIFKSADWCVGLVAATKSYFEKKRQDAFETADGQAKTRAQTNIEKLDAIEGLDTCPPNSIVQFKAHFAARLSETGDKIVSVFEKAEQQFRKTGYALDDLAIAVTDPAYKAKVEQKKNEHFKKGSVLFKALSLASEARAEHSDVLVDTLEKLAKSPLSNEQKMGMRVALTSILDLTGQNIAEREAKAVGDKAAIVEAQKAQVSGKKEVNNRDLHVEQDFARGVAEDFKTSTIILKTIGAALAAGTEKFDSFDRVGDQMGFSSVITSSGKEAIAEPLRWAIEKYVNAVTPVEGAAKDARTQIRDMSSAALKLHNHTVTDTEAEFSRVLAEGERSVDLEHEVKAHDALIAKKMADLAQHQADLEALHAEANAKREELKSRLSKAA